MTTGLELVSDLREDFIESKNPAYRSFWEGYGRIGKRFWTVRLDYDVEMTPTERMNYYKEIIRKEFMGGK